MISTKQAHSGINIGFHILILFTFLTIFFFTFIAHKERDTITYELKRAINKNMSIIMDNIDKMNQKINNKIDWNLVYELVNKIEKKYRDKSDPTIDHNRQLLKLSIIICIIIMITLIGSILYFTVYKKIDIGLGKILFENFFIFIIVGIIEVFFVLNVSLKYSPVKPSDMINQIIDRTEYHVNEKLKN